MRIVKNKIGFIIVAYLAVGVFYVIGGYLRTVVTGKGTFLPFLMPFLVPAWPWAVYGDLINYDTVHDGVIIIDVLTLIAVLISVFIFVKRYRKR